MNNTVIKIIKRENIYFEMLEDCNLSWAAKGLMGYFLTQHNYITLSYLIDQYIFDKEEITLGLKQLKDNGYILYTKEELS